MRIDRSPRRSRGFGLVDCVVGFGLIVTGLLVSMNVLPTTQRAARLARQNMLATHVARARLEQTTSLAFDSITQSTLAPVTLTTVVNGSTTSVVFTPTLAVGTISSDLKNVVCTVTWNDSASSPPTHSVTMETLVARRQ